MTVYVQRPHPTKPGKFIYLEKDKAGPPPGSGPRRFHIIKDFDEPVRSMINGKHYGSRRHYNDHVKAHGCEVVGNDFSNQPMQTPPRADPSVREDLKRTIERLT